MPTYPFGFLCSVLIAPTAETLSFVVVDDRSQSTFERPPSRPARQVAVATLEELPGSMLWLGASRSSRCYNSETHNREFGFSALSPFAIR